MKNSFSGRHYIFTPEHFPKEDYPTFSDEHKSISHPEQMRFLPLPGSCATDASAMQNYNNTI